MRIAVFDTETTGLIIPGPVPLEQQPYIIELFARVFEDGKPAEAFHALVKPPVEISDEITRITGIKASDVEGCKSFADEANRIGEFFAGVQMCIAHNMSFDEGMVENEYKRLGWKNPMPETRLCTVIEYMPRFGRRMSLKNLYEQVIGHKLDQKHRAEADVEALVEILERDGFFNNFLARPAEKKTKSKSKGRVSIPTTRESLISMVDFETLAKMKPRAKKVKNDVDENVQQVRPRRAPRKRRPRQ